MLNEASVIIPPVKIAELGEFGLINLIHVAAVLDMKILDVLRGKRF